MHKHTLIKMALAAIVAGASLPAMAGSGTSGTSGTSGSAGLGIDYAALVVAGCTGNPSMCIPGSSSEGTMGGPIAGIAKHFSKNKRNR